METREVNQQISPIRENKIDVSISEIERIILTEISKNFARSLQNYDFYTVKNRSSLIKDIINNIEICYKEKNINNAEKNNIIGKLFKNIKTELEIIDDLSAEKIDINELLVILFSVFTTYYKKILTQ